MEVFHHQLTYNKRKKFLSKIQQNCQNKIQRDNL